MLCDQPGYIVFAKLEKSGINLFIYLFIYLFIFLFIYLFIYLYFYTNIYTKTRGDFFTASTQALYCIIRYLHVPYIDHVLYFCKYLIIQQSNTLDTN